MTSDATRHKILRHLSAKSDTWASTVQKVSVEVGSQFFVEQAMKQMVESGELKRLDDGKYMPGGSIDGKYDGFNDKRLDQWPKKGGPYSYQPEDEPLTPKKAV